MGSQSKPVFREAGQTAGGPGRFRSLISWARRNAAGADGSEAIASSSKITLHLIWPNRALGHILTKRQTVVRFIYVPYRLRLGMARTLGSSSADQVGGRRRAGWVRKFRHQLRAPGAQHWHSPQPPGSAAEVDPEPFVARGLHAPPPHHGPSRGGSRTALAASNTSQGLQQPATDLRSIWQAISAPDQLMLPRVGPYRRVKPSARSPLHHQLSRGTPSVLRRDFDICRVCGLVSR